MTFLDLNMKLNEIISAWLEDGGDPARCADALRMIADEVFDEVGDDADFDDGWDAGMLASLIKALHTLQTDEDREADAMRAQHEAWVKDRERGWR